MHYTVIYERHEQNMSSLHMKGIAVDTGSVIYNMECSTYGIIQRHTLHSVHSCSIASSEARFGTVWQE
jgi:hypothetical protein